DHQSVALFCLRLPFLKEKTSDELNYAKDVIDFLSHIGTHCFIMSLCQCQQVSGLLYYQSHLHDCISLSDMNCASILNARGAETICLHMNEPEPSGQVLFRSSEILWNLLERCNMEEVTAQLCSMECVVSLKEAFCHQLLNTSQHFDLQLRNDLLVITSFIAESPNSLLIESLFAKQLVLFATFAELKTHIPLIHNLKLSYSNEDLKMKKLLLNLLVLMSKDSAALQVGDTLSLCSRRWSAVQQEELQLQALATLATIAPLMLDDYMSCQGNACLLLLLDWCVGPDSYFSQGHSFHGTGGRGSKRAQMRRCIRVLRSVTSLEEESVNQDLCDQGTIGQLLGNKSGLTPDEEDAVALEMKSDLQLIISALCETDMHRKELFGSEGVEMTINFLKKGCDKFYSGLGHNKLVLSTVDCVRSCIIGCYTTEDYFLAQDGVFLLLDLLAVRSCFLPLLWKVSRLCDNPNTVSHILDWRDGGGQTAARLLLQLWRDEEEDLGLKRDQHGGITGLSAQHDIHPSLHTHMSSAAVLEISENLRAKIYSIFCKLGFQELPGLSTKDYVTLSIVRRYLDLKVGEVWDEISRELSLEGVRPITPDQEALNAICRITEDTARRIATEQSSIVERQRQEDVSEEQLMYTEIKSHWKQRELLAKSRDNYVAKTSNYEILKVLYVYIKIHKSYKGSTCISLFLTQFVMCLYAGSKSTEAEGH
uniref:Cilia- and flagella-associated protein 69 ARM repeats domain-containing protein n=1 Tax=Stegastes partitus TaxID=144197 RepID=A0A3B4ZLS7_9TELE